MYSQYLIFAVFIKIIPGEQYMKVFVKVLIAVHCHCLPPVTTALSLGHNLHRNARVRSGQLK